MHHRLATGNRDDRRPEICEFIEPRLDDLQIDWF